MAITGGRFMRCGRRTSDGEHDYSVTVQGRGVGAICEVTLVSHWGTDSNSDPTSSSPRRSAPAGWRNSPKTIAPVRIS